MSFSIVKELYVEFQKLTTTRRFNTFLIGLLILSGFAYYDLKKEAKKDREVASAEKEAIYNSWILFLTEKNQSDKDTYERTLKLEFEIEQIRRDLKEKKDYEKTIE